MKCYLCGKEIINSYKSLFIENYCKECLKLIICECEQALLDIEDKEKWKI